MAEDPLNRSALRCFLALPLHELFHDELRCILGTFRRGIPGVRGVEPRQVHLTLHFFGSIPPSEIDHIDGSMRQVASLYAPLRVALDGVGGFPDLKRPDILWLGMEDKAGTLLSFQKALRAAVGQLGFKTETRPFYPHVTIGRIKKRTGSLETLASRIPFRFPSAEKTADHFALYQSHCLPEGVRYEILKTYPFSKKT